MTTATVTVVQIATGPAAGLWRLLLLWLALFLVGAAAAAVAAFLLSDDEDGES